MHTNKPKEIAIPDALSPRAQQAEHAILTKQGLPVYPPVQVKQPVALNTVHTEPLDKVQAEPTPRT